MDTATITVRALNQTNGSFGVAGVDISFSLTDATLGTIAAPQNVLTDSEGYAHAVMTVKNKSGIATINARNSTLNATTSLKIFAPYPDETHITSSADWLVANGSDRGTITVSAFNTTSSRVPIAGLNVTFSVNASIFGAVNPITVQTNSQGNASTVFTTGKKSGVAVISGNLTPLVNGVPYILLNVSQKIDHDTPYRISDYNYTNEIEVGDMKPFAFTFSDRWGNLIDNRRIAENVSISITSPSPEYNASLSLDNSTFSTSVLAPVNGAGITAGLVRMNTRPGWNIFIIHPLMYTPSGELAIPDKYLTIEGIPTKPVRIVAEFDPSNFRQYADGESKFHINYTMWDKFGNFVQNRSLYVETSIPGEDHQVGTNAQGVAMLTYGPKSSIGMIWIIATAMDNATLQHRQQVWFVSQEPTDMLLTASPQTMPSFDIPPGNTADILAEVVDELGNPVENETITFSIEPGSVRYDRPNYNITSGPSLSANSGLTDSDGYAIIQFTPGSFYTNQSDNTSLATGRCNVLANWRNESRGLNITRSVSLIWKNYPYLSLSTSVSSNVIQTNETVDIMITLVGDGYKLQPNPIDVVLCTDRSGSMLFDDPDRMYSIREAAKQFVNNMTASRDRIGLVTFGRSGSISRPGYNSGISTSEIDNTYIYPRTYSGYATLDKTLTNNFTDVKNELDKIVPDHGTPMREGLRLSIQNLSKYNRTGAVKAIVLLSDGDYNWYGDPLARGSGSSNDPTDYGDLTTNYRTFTGLGSGQFSNQNMSVYAKNNNISIYSIAFADTISSGGRATLAQLANSSGGKYYVADASNIVDVYRAIARDLQTAAGANTNMTLYYDQVELNYTFEQVNDSVLQYQYINGISTYINSYLTSDHSTPSHTPAYPYTLNQTANWTSTPKKLYFDVGTIYLYQVWEAKYRLRMEKPGLYNIFAPSSIVSFNNGTASLTFPDMYVTVIANMTNTNVTTNVLQYTNVSEVTGMTGPEADLFKTFNITSIYTSRMNVTEEYYIVTYDGRRWFMGSRTLTPQEANQTRQFRVRVADLPAGWRYLDPVANVFDAPGPARIPPVPMNPPQMNPNKIYINLT